MASDYPYHTVAYLPAPRQTYTFEIYLCSYVQLG
jgi:hypothetical protein